MPAPLATLVIPAYRESRRLPTLLEGLVAESAAPDAPVLVKLRLRRRLDRT